MGASPVQVHEEILQQRAAASAAVGAAAAAAAAEHYHLLVDPGRSKSRGTTSNMIRLASFLGNTAVTPLWRQRPQNEGRAAVPSSGKVDAQ